MEDGGYPPFTGFVYADTSMVLATIGSDPAGCLRVCQLCGNEQLGEHAQPARGKQWVPVCLVAQWCAAAPSGVAVSKMDLNVSSTTAAIAHYVPGGDSDGDGVTGSNCTSLATRFGSVG